MKSISFLDDAIPSVLSGKKTQTIRLGETFEENEKVKLTKQNGEFLGYLFIITKRKRSLKELNQQDAALNNWNSTFELKQRLLSIYPESCDQTVFSCYEFRFELD